MLLFARARTARSAVIRVGLFFLANEDGGGRDHNEKRSSLVHDLNRGAIALGGGGFDCMCTRLPYNKEKWCKTNYPYKHLGALYTNYTILN